MHLQEHKRDLNLLNLCSWGWFLAARGVAAELEHLRQASAQHSCSSSTHGQRDLSAWEPKLGGINPKASSGEESAWQTVSIKQWEMCCILNGFQQAELLLGCVQPRAPGWQAACLPHHSPCPSVPSHPCSATLKGQFSGLNRG